MQAAQILAGYSLGEADLLRRAMGKKKQEEMDKQRERFVSGCADKQIPTEQANELFDLIDKFAGYGFNKSHAAAYALLAYQTAWMKTYHPQAFFAASMCFDMHQTDKLAIFVDDMRRLEINCLPPCVNKSEAEYSVEKTDEGLAVRYALAGLKNVGEKAMEGLAASRKQDGLYKSLDDFAGRIDPSQINRRSLENLAASGAFDMIEPNRGAIAGAADLILATANSAKESRESGQGGFFDGDSGGDGANIRLKIDESWSVGEIMAHEKDAFGFYFAAHPVSQFQAVAESYGAKSYGELMQIGHIPEGTRRAAKMAAMVEGTRWRETRRGKRFVMVELSDSSGQFSASCFEESIAERLAEWGEESACLLVDVEMDMPAGEETPRFAISGAKPLEGLTSVSRLKMEMQVDSVDAIQQLQHVVAPLQDGRCELVITAPSTPGQFVEISLGKRFLFDVEVKNQLEAIAGIHKVQLAPLGPPHLSVVR